MAILENRIPKQNDTVTVEGHTGSFVIIGIDAMNKTVEVRATLAPFGVFIAPWATIAHAGQAMKKEPSPKKILAVTCPTCGAAPGKKCELTTGQPRNEPHRARRLIAAD